VTTPPTQPSRPARLDPATVREWLASADGGPRRLDVRTAAEFETAHIPGSYNVPLHLLREHRDEISRHLDQLVLVCRSGNRAAQAEQVLAATGMTNLHILDGGILGWENAGAPIRHGRRRWDLERQVRLVAGTLVVLGVLGSLAVPGLQWFAALIGAGLAVAALTNTCLMGTLLAKLPFNRAAGCDIDAVVRQLTDTNPVRS
jgi:rhodanese-related sulfurtransferase